MQARDHAESAGRPKAASAEIHSKIAEGLTKVAACARTIGLYGREHPMVEEMANAAHYAVTEMLGSGQAIVLAVLDTTLAVDSFPLEDTSGSLFGFVKMLQERKVAELDLRPGVTLAEVLSFVELLSIPPDDLAAAGGLAAELQKRQMEHIGARSGGLPAESRLGKDAADIYEEALVSVEEAMGAVQAGLRIPVGEIRLAVANSLNGLIADGTALVALAGIKSYDRYLAEHSVNVCILSMLLGRDLGMDVGAALELGICAMLHDVGKVFVASEIVKKPGKLGESEWQQIMRHPVEGARALAGLPGLPVLAPTIALEHHVHCDGTGYPSLAARSGPHLLSRLVSIVDTYDALTANRPYREAWTPQQAIGWMLYESGRQYDRELLARFAARAKLFPIGALVRLANGERAVVVGGNFEEPTMPIVRIIAGRDGKPIAPTVIDLSTSKDPALRIESTAQPVEALLPIADRLAA